MNKCFGYSNFGYNYHLSRIKETRYINANSCIGDYVTQLKYQYPFLEKREKHSNKKNLYFI